MLFNKGFAAVEDASHVDDPNLCGCACTIGFVAHIEVNEFSADTLGDGLAVGCAPQVYGTSLAR